MVDHVARIRTADLAVGQISKKHDKMESRRADEKHSEGLELTSVDMVGPVQSDREEDRTG
eukprot:CAMPEP_0206543816 /NCGR_PEP_ID=MMETSP0325_2-20121206/11120_1 /ASSEMBLY_ACC=CAM_ASM_000347 /TAXON_ID=2866 /ORGANISM="Crypthecodinium cohnii, Strain Seligo" /LENGTH=59 /DNA_ID=CAMNT_0054042391 /DNA_START=452 /DNA_END=631 /DNA_ORIENTATION=+